MRKAPLLGWVLAASLAAGCGRPAGPHSTAVPGTEAAALALWGSRVAQADRLAFAARDANGDGALIPAELPGYDAATFLALDADRDGQLDLAEATRQGASAWQRARTAVSYAAASLLMGGEVPALPIGPPAAATGNPVLLVPGYLDLELYFGRLKKQMRTLGRDATYVALFPNIGDIRLAAGVLKAEVEKVKTRTGASQVDIVAHSEGGLIARYYMKHMAPAGEVERLVTLATPYHGTLLGYLGPGLGAKQMRPGSDFLRELNAPDRAPEGVKVTSIRAGLDEIIVPHDSPILEGAQNELVKIAEHATIFVHGQALAHVQAGLAR